MSEQVILVNEYDVPCGIEEKMQAHRDGKLHRAFSVFVIAEQDGEYYTLLQQRHITKYHCGGLWSNTCCSHPRPEESVTQAAERRLVEEMGIHASMQPVGSFLYKADFDNGLTEHEFDHVLISIVKKDISFNINTYEVMDSKWEKISDLVQVAGDLSVYTPWFQQALNIVHDFVKSEEHLGQEAHA